MTNYKSIKVRIRLLYKTPLKNLISFSLFFFLTERNIYICNDRRFRVKGFNRSKSKFNKKHRCQQFADWVNYGREGNQTLGKENCNFFLNLRYHPLFNKPLEKTPTTSENCQIR